MRIIGGAGCRRARGSHDHFCSDACHDRFVAVRPRTSGRSSGMMSIIANTKSITGPSRRSARSPRYRAPGMHAAMGARGARQARRPQRRDVPRPLLAERRCSRSRPGLVGDGPGLVRVHRPDLPARRIGSPRSSARSSSSTAAAPFLRGGVARDPRPAARDDAADLAGDRRRVRRERRVGGRMARPRVLVGARAADRRDAARSLAGDEGARPGVRARSRRWRRCCPTTPRSSTTPETDRSRRASCAGRPRPRAVRAAACPRTA